MVGSSNSDHSILLLHVFLSLEPPCTHRTSKPLSPTMQLNYQGTCATWKPAARGSGCEHTGLIENKAISLPGEAAETRWLKPGMMVHAWNPSTGPGTGRRTTYYTFEARLG